MCRKPRSPPDSNGCAGGLPARDYQQSIASDDLRHHPEGVNQPGLSAAGRRTHPAQVMPRPPVQGQNSQMTTPTATKPADPLALLRTRRYVVLLVLAAVLGVPIAAIAYGFLKLVAVLQNAVFTNFPAGSASTPSRCGGRCSRSRWRACWSHSPSATCRVRAVTRRPTDSTPEEESLLRPRSPACSSRRWRPLSLGAVLGPEAPLIALGAGLAVLAVHFSRREMPAQTLAVVGAAGSFAAIATLFGSPLPAAFLLMEVVGVGGAMLDLALLPGLLAAGIGALIFVGLDAWTGFGTFSLAVPNLPKYSHPDLAQFGWALVLAPVAAVLGVAIRRIALAMRPHVERRMLFSRRWSGWPSPAWRSRSRPPPGRVLPRSCSPGSQRSARSSARPEVTRSGAADAALV